MINRLTTLLTYRLFQIHNVVIFVYLAGVIRIPYGEKPLCSLERGPAIQLATMGRARTGVGLEPYASGVIRRACWAIFSS